jgi:hypothetical protein
MPMRTGMRSGMIVSPVVAWHENARPRFRVPRHRHEQVFKLNARVIFMSGTATSLKPLLSGRQQGDLDMTFGKGALLWILGIPLPIILLLALFWR